MSANEDQQKAIDLISRGENIFLTGSGGKGKSWVINEITTPDTVVVAPTGIAALHVGGTTCHSAFGLPLGLVSDEDWGDIRNTVRKRFDKWSTVDRIIIDEVSMLRADYLDLIDYKLRKIRKTKQRFGGIQVIPVGDFYQLPAIVSKNEQKHFKENYQSSFAFSAAAWNFQTVHLTKPMRQKDEAHVMLLDNIRQGLYVKDSLEIIRDISQPEENPDMLRLCCYNKDADRINSLLYQKIPDEEFVYYAKKDKTWGKDEPVPSVLKLKKGTKVLIAANDRKAGYVNGDTGQVVELDEDAIHVRLDSGKTVKVGEHRWEKYSYTTENGYLEKIVTACFDQLPVKYGWAVSIHKSQGMTLDGVSIDVGAGCFSHGQLYVALSRVRNLENIHLMEKIQEKDVIVEKAVRDFYQRN